MSKITRIDEQKKIRLSDIGPSGKGDVDREKCDAGLQKLHEEFAELQEWLYAAQKHSVLIVLQGMDTSGKDGTVSHVMSSINPQGCSVASFKVPTPQESLHDFLWRVHPHAPARGMITIFNRSHYEDVLVTRVHDIVDDETCRKRYEHIRNFEALLADNNTLILKFFLHISKEEQKERLLAREQDQSKAWKLSTGDWQERKYWDAYQEAYELAIGATAAPHAPWYIVPADHKWYRNYAIAETIVSALRAHKDEWTKALEALGQERLKELQEMRAGGSNGK